MLLRAEGKFEWDEKSGDLGIVFFRLLERRLFGLVELDAPTELVEQTRHRLALDRVARLLAHSTHSIERTK